MLPHTEIERAQSHYTQRDQKMPFEDWHHNIYHLRHPLGQLFRFHNIAVVTKALNTLNLGLQNQRLLDVGCGYGHWLRTFIELGAEPQYSVGLDIMPDRLQHGFSKNSAVNWLLFDGQQFPLQAAGFDFVSQIVVFSSVLDEAVRARLAREMFRVLKPGGYFLWIDHQAAHGAELAGFTEADVQKFWPQSEVVYKARVHPRYFRRLYRRFRWAAELLYHLTDRGCDSLLLVLRKEQ